MNRVHQVGFIVFSPMIEKLLNIEKKFTKDSFKSKLNFIREFGSTLMYF
jgi:hypothetical protein